MISILEHILVVIHHEVAYIPFKILAVYIYIYICSCWKLAGTVEKWSINHKAKF